MAVERDQRSPSCGPGQAVADRRPRSRAGFARQALRPVVRPALDVAARVTRPVATRRQRRAGFFEPETFLEAYRTGRFLRSDRWGRLGWVAPQHRAVVPVDDELHIPRKIAKFHRNGRFEIRYDTAFAQVVRHCATVAGRDRTRRPWLTPDAERVYVQLHERGIAHSVEAWSGGRLVGGEFGLAVGGFYCAESTFHLVPNAGKVAFADVAQRLRRRGFLLHDRQELTPVNAQFGGQTVPRADYEARLAGAIAADVAF